MINKLDDENDGLTDFFWAIFHDNKEVVKLFIEYAY